MSSPTASDKTKLIDHTTVVPDMEGTKVNSFSAMRQWNKDHKADKKDGKEGKEGKEDEKQQKPVDTWTPPPLKTLQSFYALKHGPKEAKKQQFILTYFPGRGRAELARLLLAEAQIPYEDYRMTDTQWPSVKPNYPFGTLPSFEKLGSFKIAESAAIERYIARIGGLYGKTDDEAARIDMFYEYFKNFIPGFFSIAWIKNATEKAAKLQEFFEKDLPLRNKELTIQLKQTLDGKHYFVGKSVSLADISFYRGYSEIIAANANALDDYPELAALYKRVMERENISKWLKERPQSNF
jgi:glutathione S-transferase